jgi:TPR repeat protein
MDKLEMDPNSRAKVLPPPEMHLLYAVHLHGGTSSQLDWNNKPDESLEAIQFYHFKAARTVDPDPSAAMTLATLYHFGYRGVEQNLTMALFYYGR